MLLACLTGILHELPSYFVVPRTEHGGTLNDLPGIF